MNYNEFLLSELLSLHNKKFDALPYDLKFSIAKELFKRYECSQYNIKEKGEYECIESICKELFSKLNFTDTEYLGQGIGCFDRLLTYKYNRLLNLLGSTGIVEQFERYIDEEDLVGFIKHIEGNLLENDVELPYSVI